MKKRSQASSVSFGAVMAAIVAVATLISIPMPYSHAGIQALF